MGYKLANAAYHAGAELAGVLSERARLALDFMARTARDVGNGISDAGVYEGGYLGVAIHLLGLEKGGSEAGRTAAKRALRELQNAGLVKLHERGGAGKVSTFRVLLGDPAPVDNSRSGR